MMISAFYSFNSRIKRALFNSYNGPVLEKSLMNFSKIFLEKREYSTQGLITPPALSSAIRTSASFG